VGVVERQGAGFVQRGRVVNRAGARKQQQ